MFDLKIAGGHVFDGTGAPSRRADVGIRGDAIAEVGDLSRAEARETVDASDRLVCPGFIDVHSHSDTYLLIRPSADSKITQGVTTEVVGNCGASAAPLYPSNRMPSDWADKAYPARWASVAEYRALIEAARPAVNVVLLVGHNTLRAGVAGYENRPLREDELREMENRLARSLDEGARGLSSGLAYPPGIFAPPEELYRLARTAAARGAIYTSHMRSESDRLPEAVAETVEVGRRTGIRVQVSHLKTAGKRNWGLLDHALETIESARADGVEVAADRYPYTCSCTDLDILFPDWAEEGGREAVLRRLRDPADRARIREALLRAQDDDYWETVVIGSTSHPDNLRFRGVRLTDAARALGLHPADAVLHFTDTDDLRTTAFFFGMSEANMRRIFALPYVMLGSDASLRAPEGPLGQDHPHPRAYGSFPRFLRMALDGDTVALADAVHKLTGLPAAQFRLADRGVIAPGKRADVVVLDPATLRDTATFGAPHQFAEGVVAVAVNGVLTLSSGRLTDRRGGRFI